MPGPLIPFHVAAEHLAGWSSGQLVRYGPLLKDANTGRIVAHLQETGFLRRALEQAVRNAKPLNWVGDGVKIIQNEQIKGKLQLLETAVRTVQGLQLANLAVSAIGVGVTVASTVMMVRRLEQLESSLGEVANEVAEQVRRDSREQEIKHLLVDVHTDLQRWQERDAWQQDAKLLDKLEDSFDHAFGRCHQYTLELIESRSRNTMLFQSLFAALGIVGGTQMQLLLRANETKVAAQRANRYWNAVEQLSWELPPDTVNRLLPEDESGRLGIDVSVQSLCEGFAGHVALTETLVKADISGRQYLEQADAEQEEVMLLLPHVS